MYVHPKTTCSNPFSVSLPKGKEKNNSNNRQQIMICFLFPSAILDVDVDDLTVKMIWWVCEREREKRKKNLHWVGGIPMDVVHASGGRDGGQRERLDRNEQDEEEHWRPRRWPPDAAAMATVARPHSRRAATCCRLLALDSTAHCVVLVVLATAAAASRLDPAHWRVSFSC